VEKQDAFADVITDSYDSQEVILKWWDDSPIELHRKKLQLPQFTMMEPVSHTCDETYKTGNVTYKTYRVT